MYVKEHTYPAFDSMQQIVLEEGSDMMRWAEVNPNWHVYFNQKLYELFGVSGSEQAKYIAYYFTTEDGYCGYRNTHAAIMNLETIVIYGLKGCSEADKKWLQSDWYPAAKTAVLAMSGLNK